jgi:protein phosphatase
MAQQLVDAGAIQSIDQASRLLQNMLVNCIGGRGRKEVEVDVRRLQIADGDRLLLCTDGLTDMVDESTIADTLRVQVNPDTACRTLVDLALDHGGRDNVTVVIGRFSVEPA